MARTRSAKSTRRESEGKKGKHVKFGDDDEVVEAVEGVRNDAEPRNEDSEGEEEAGVLSVFNDASPSRERGVSGRDEYRDDDDQNDDDDGDDDAAPEEVPLSSVRDQARQRRKRETAARDGARKAEKAKRRRVHEKRAQQKQDREAVTIPQDLLEQLAKEQEEKREAEETEREGRLIASAADYPEEPAGPVSVVVLPPSGGLGVYNDASAVSAEKRERESAALFWRKSVAGSDSLGGGRDANALRGAYPTMVVQPGRAALYSPHIDFNS